MLYWLVYLSRSVAAVQAAQVRKSHYMAEAGVPYCPEAHHTSTLHAGTVVQQVCSDAHRITKLYQKTWLIISLCHPSHVRCMTLFS